jgi:hypothetical protein
VFEADPMIGLIVSIAPVYFASLLLLSGIFMANQSSHETKSTRLTMNNQQNSDGAAEKAMANQSSPESKSTRPTTNSEQPLDGTAE